MTLNAEATHSVDHNHASAEHAPQATGVKRKRTRSPSKPKAAYFVLQVLDPDGNAVSIDKRQVKILAIERDSDKVLDMIDSGDHENAFYLRGMLPPIR